MKELINNWIYVVIMCLTLGLAPFVPEPHIWGKIKWIADGAKGMEWLDWLDFIFHGIPWVLMIRLLFLKIKDRLFS
ncbi:hypothetical protein [Aquiflexum sp.]|uniref:hypothetical protein n=1 Tax=Aquiflexum sp. TaxID=1872584 RepID=UPI0035936C8E